MTPTLPSFKCTFWRCFLSMDCFRFNDNLDGKRAPFSIQNVAVVGSEYGRLPGQWYGPQAIFVVLSVKPERS